MTTTSNPHQRQLLEEMQLVAEGGAIVESGGELILKACQLFGRRGDGVIINGKAMFKPYPDKKFPKAGNDNKQRSKPYQGIVSSGELVRGFTPPDYHIDGVVQARFFYSLTGMTGTGKTAVLLLMAASTALNLAIGGREVRGGRVLYFAGENPDDVTMRWIAMAHEMGFDPDNVDVHFIKGTLNVTEMFDRIKADVEALGGVDMIVIDTSAAYFFGADENSNVEAGNHARSMRKLCELPGR